jgi:putative nucleotidyltransferase with HDIG domain
MPSSLSVPSLRSVPTDPYAARERHHNEGHGRRLTAAFEALEAFPVLSESRNRVVRLFEEGSPAIEDVVEAVESDVALAIAVLRLANKIDGPDHGKVDSAMHGIEILSPQTVLAIATHARTYDFFDRGGTWQGVPERFRLHAVATQRAAGRLARELGHENPDRLSIAALLHDIGKLVLVHAYPGYPVEIHRDAQTPEERVQAERRELGVDHALVGGVLARRWGLPRSLAQVIEAHHAATPEGDTALVRLADMLAHYMLGDPISPAELLAVSRIAGLEPAQLRKVMYDLPLPSHESRPRRIEPCPLSPREADVLRSLASGKVYKQIASDLGLSTSTIRTHLHNMYRKLGAADRAQAVLIATERGWL